MHGLLKIVGGQVDVNVYTKWYPQNDTLEIPQFLQDKQHFIQQGLVFPTEKVSLSNITSAYETLILTPGKSLNTYLLESVKKKMSQTFSNV